MLKVTSEPPQILSEHYNLGNIDPDIQVYNVDIRGDRSLTLRYTQRNATQPPPAKFIPTLPILPILPLISLAVPLISNLLFHHYSCDILSVLI